jgi:hypothetical protein
LVLVIVAISYRQTIFAYPSGGGAYIVAKDNLGRPGTGGRRSSAGRLCSDRFSVDLCGRGGHHLGGAGNALGLIDNHKVLICLVLIAFIAVANLRGARVGSPVCRPTYSFVISFCSWWATASFIT